MIKTKNTKSFIAEALVACLKSLDDPPAKDYIVDKRTIKTDTLDPTYFTAMVTIVTDYAGVKKNQVKVRFLYSFTTTLVPAETVSYL